MARMSERWTWEQLMACAGDVAIADADMDRRPPPGDLVARMLMQAAVTERALAGHRAWLVAEKDATDAIVVSAFADDAGVVFGLQQAYRAALADLNRRLAQGEDQPAPPARPEGGQP